MTKLRKQKGAALLEPETAKQRAGTSRKQNAALNMDASGHKFEVSPCCYLYRVD